MTIKLIPLGFLFPSDRAPLEDGERYNDYIRVEYEIADARAMLAHGTFDNGLMVRMEYHGAPGGVGVIVPDPEGGQMVKPLEEVLEVVK